MTDTPTTEPSRTAPGAPTTATLPTTSSVTAVLVTRGRTAYLPTTLTALAGQARRPVRVLLVDVSPTSSAQDHAALRLDAERAFAAAGGAGQPALHLVHVPRARTFGDAVRAALTADEGARTTWLWLLHDDSAPAPTALAELARAVGRAPSVAVAGVKQRTWTDPERLLEVGLRTARSGRRMTDVEAGELDQGQHDARDDVLGVGLAGALVRRDVWEDLGGPDPALGAFGDGLDLSRRARLAGHRVVVVPAAVVRHAQATYLGLRDVAPGRDAPVDADGDGEDDRADPARSFRARRRSVTHQRLVSGPLPLLPVVVLLVLASSLVRALVQVAAKQPGLAVDELRGPLTALARPRAVYRARRQATRTRRLPRRALRPLQARWRDVWAQERDRRLARAEQRRVVQAPSELELAELAALATRRRATLATVTVGLVAVVAVAFGPLVGAVAGGGRLVGGALLPLADGLGDLWSAANAWWVSGELGAPGPADALLRVLAAPTAVLGGDPRLAVAAVLLGAVLLAGLGAWAAAGALTRSVVLRAWAALVWAGAPALLLGAGDGRLGPVLAHVLLPWAALGLVRAVGVQRVDQVVSGVLTAQRTPEQEHLRHADPDAAEHDATDGELETPPVDEAGTDPTGVLPVEAAADPDAVREVVAAVTADEEVAQWVGAPAPTGSVTAAAAASLVLAAVVGASPGLLVPVVLAVLAAAACARRFRRRLVVALLPALVVSAPLLVEVASRGADGVRLLAADAGLPWAVAPAGALERLLGVPADAAALVPESVPDGLARLWPYGAGAVVVLLAVLALLRGPVARGVRLAWVLAALGLATATTVALMPVGLQDGVVAYGWTGPGLSFALLGLLAAAVLGADGVRGALAGYSFGWRQPLVGIVACGAVLVPVLWLGGWSVQARDGTALTVTALERAVVPAVGRQTQESADAARVLAVVAGAGAPDADVSWALLRADGPQLVEHGATVATTSVRPVRGVVGDARVVAPDEATAEVAAVVARLAQGATGDVAGPLAALGVGDVLVPALDTRGADADRAGALRRAREALVAELDSTAGLERVTQSGAGILWRVSAAPAGAQDGAEPDRAETAADVGTVVTAWARLVAAGDSLTDPATAAVPVAATGRGVDTRIGRGAPGRLVVLAERADPSWRATLDGRALRAVDNGWRQTFEVGAQAGHLEITYDPPARVPLAAVQGVVLAVALLLALPVRRRRPGR
ncbi:glycosyltransferase [Cellulomonas sp.]|uniref:glycosyltransferase n=1 Tax=Cellulomonas sp. TaxID=40001 RepID=UPI00258DA3C9|nr:glycosyltransferase [Cellulomonas sp.]